MSMRWKGPIRDTRPRKDKAYWRWYRIQVPEMMACKPPNFGREGRKDDGKGMEYICEIVRNPPVQLDLISPDNRSKIRR